MSDLRTAAQQALNYWESASFGDAVMVDKMDALRAALAQRAEPEGSVCARCGALAFDPLVPQQAEPVEPVEPVPAAVVATQSDVWRGYNGQWQAPGEPIKMVRVLLRDLPTGTLLYTAPPPPQRLPLTDEEIDKIFKHLCNTVGASCKTMARAVERAHGIKE